MTLKWGIEEGDYEGLPEPLQGEYSKNSEDGKYYPDIGLPEGWEVANTANLRSALAAERTATGKLRGNQKRFDGLDPDYARQCIDKVEKGLDPKAEDTWKAREKQLLDRHAEEKDGWEKKTGRLTGQLREILLDKEALEALTAAKCKRPKKLLPHMLARMRMEEEGERFKTTVLDDHGNEGVADARGNPMTPEYLANQLKNQEDFAIDFDGTGHSGAGGEASPDDRPKGGRSPWQLTESEAQDRGKYLEARAAAIKEGRGSVEIVD
jgi:hypothetical protein